MNDRDVEKNEYQPPKEELGETYSTFEEPVLQPQASRFQRVIKNKRFILALLFIIAVVLVYEFVGRSNNTDQTSTTTPLQKPTVAPAITEMPSAASEKLRSQMTSLGQQVDANQAQLAQLQNNLVALQNSQIDLTNQVAALKTNMQQLMADIQRLTA